MRKFDTFDENGFSQSGEPEYFMRFDWVDALIIGGFVLFFVGILTNII